LSAISFAVKPNGNRGADQCRLYYRTVFNQIDCLFDSFMDWFVPAAVRGRNITQSVKDADGTQCIILDENTYTVHSNMKSLKKNRIKSYLIFQVTGLRTTIAAPPIPNKLSK
jgi:hypothetical protein